MSKKIIYLLSLLMALSLVFASCKKNDGGFNPGGIGGGIESPEEVIPPSEGLDPNTGLFNDQNVFDQYATKVVQSSEVAKYANNNYMRNPVISVINGNTVFIAYEVRQQSEGSGNDVALTGTNNVDIAYIVSTKSGRDWFDVSPAPKYINQASSIDQSHGAPIVYNTGTHIIIVASAGIGLSVGTYDTYTQPADKTDKSWLEYTYAPITANGVGEFSAWKEISGITMADINTAMQKTGDQAFQQYGTHTARGVVVGDTGAKKILLPVTVAKFINDGSWANSRWGYIVYSLDVNAGELSNPRAQGQGQEMNTTTDKTKTTRVATATAVNKFITLTVSDNFSKLVLYKGTDGTGSQATQIKAGDGSPGILVVNKWAGKTSYDPQQYNTASVTGVQKSFISHITELPGYYTKKLAIREVDNDFTMDASSLYYVEGYQDAAKSSSIDILADGTIVMAAEGGTVDGTQSKQYKIHFSRYTQAYLADKMGIN